MTCEKGTGPIAARVRGKRATVQGPVPSDPGYYRLNEHKGLIFNERCLIPIDDDDDEAFKRFMSGIDLTPLNPWLEDA
jgi:hypothetical protein